MESKLLIGADVPGTKVRSAEDLSGMPVEVLPTTILRLGRRFFPFHRNLVSRLREFEPDVILCEGESHLLGYLQAIYFRWRFKRRTGLVHWCFIGIPGELPKGRITEGIKRVLRRCFDTFLVYSSFSKDRLVEHGVDPSRAFVATNVGPVGRILAECDDLPWDKEAIRKRVGLPGGFTVLFCGSLEENKRPEVMLDLAERLPDVRFVIIGGGPLLETLQRRIPKLGLANVSLVGRVSEGLHEYYGAADVLLVPGRGGIVISESMAAGVPVIVHQADGTEYDLVVTGETGVLVERGDSGTLAEAVASLAQDPRRTAEMGRAAQERIRTQFNEEAMVEAMIQAAAAARAARSRG